MPAVRASTSIDVGTARLQYVDNLKVLLVAGVIVGHATIAWTGAGSWVLEEPHIREPFLSLASMLMVSALFAMALFFALAGMFTVPSLARKGPRRFLGDRFVRLGIPMVFFVIFLSPVVEYFDTDNLYWDNGFFRFVPEAWRQLAPGPTWFLGVLLVFSVGFTVLRVIHPAPLIRSAAPKLWHLAVLAAVVAVATFLIRLVVPLGEEVWHLSISQAPGWLAGFALGVLGAERGWFDPVDRRLATVARRVSVGTIAASIVTLAYFSGRDLTLIAGGGTWESALPAVFEGLLVVSVPFWIIDLFQRRYDRQGLVLRAMSRTAFAAFVIHQAVLVGLILLIRHTPGPPELEYVTVSALAIAASFGLGGLALKVPAVRRVM